MVWKSRPWFVDAAAFFTDCSYQIAPVTEGNRLVLEYDLCVDSNYVPATREPSKQDFVDNLAAKSIYKLEGTSMDEWEESESHLGNHLVDPGTSSPLRHFVEDSLKINCMDAVWKEMLAENQHMKYGILLKHRYPQSPISPSMLKGVDAKLFAEVRKEPSLVALARLCPILVKTSFNINRNDKRKRGCHVNCFLLDREASGIDNAKELSLLELPQFPAGFLWAHAETVEREDWIDETFVVKKTFLAAALFVERMDCEKAATAKKI